MQGRLVDLGNAIQVGNTEKRWVPVVIGGDPTRVALEHVANLRAAVMAAMASVPAEIDGAESAARDASDDGCCEDVRRAFHAAAAGAGVQAFVAAQMGTNSFHVQTASAADQKEVRMHEISVSVTADKEVRMHEIDVKAEADKYRMLLNALADKQISEDTFARLTGASASAPGASAET